MDGATDGPPLEEDSAIVTPADDTEHESDVVAPADDAVQEGAVIAAAYDMEQVAAPPSVKKEKKKKKKSTKKKAPSLKPSFNDHALSDSRARKAARRAVLLRTRRTAEAREAAAAMAVAVEVAGRFREEAAMCGEDDAATLRLRYFERRRMVNDAAVDAASSTMSPASVPFFTSTAHTVV